ncbi:hypothetical protein [Pyxidicoccus sp. MSG2]|uniref:hypothetical protein n=1 Tax=Pyxidicoccus sp. MSG2 TaxID=2996790 RepID=UPI00226F06B5|nr:hypothetical protein [Pyxidicoccus sp. MSG2]MCY1022370.1 hypothetical protein [Pyxidicoccus sp. MSG2]
MGKVSRASPVEALRNLALGLERLAAREAAVGAVSGAADGLRKEMPELDSQLRSLLQDSLTVLGRLVHDAAEHEHVEVGGVAHAMASAATQGALEALEREWQEGGLPFHAFAERINHLLDGVAAFARQRTEEIRTPGERAQVMARGMVTAVTEQLHAAAPGFVEDARKFAPAGAEIASKIGRGVADGLASKLQEDSDALVGLLERAGRGLVRGLAEGIREEVAKRPAETGAALVSSLEMLAERAAAATVRGASGALEVQGLRWREALRRDGLVRKASRELVGGALEALGTGLRRPVMAVVGAGSALVALSVLAVRWRTA